MFKKSFSNVRGSESLEQSSGRPDHLRRPSMRNKDWQTCQEQPSHQLCATSLETTLDLN